MFVLVEYENVISLSDRTMLGPVACVGAGVTSLTVCVWCRHAHGFLDDVSSGFRVKWRTSETVMLSISQDGMGAAFRIGVFRSGISELQVSFADTVAT